MQLRNPSCLRQTSGLVEFTIDSADCANCQATATVLGRPCGVEMVEDEEYGQITVYDPLCCLLNEPDDDLVGRLGYATRLKLTEQFSQCCADEYGIPTDTCIWAVVYLCPPVCE